MPMSVAAEGASCTSVFPPISCSHFRPFLGLFDFPTSEKLAMDPIHIEFVAPSVN